MKEKSYCHLLKLERQMKLDERYEFVFFAAKYDYNRVMYGSLDSCCNATFTDGPGKHGSILRFLHRIHTAPKINRVLPLPFREYWFKKYFIPHRKVLTPYCFVFQAGYLNMIHDFRGYIEYLKKRFPSSRFVLFYEDRIATMNMPLTPVGMRDYFNLQISYDPGEAESYGLLYHHTAASTCNIEVHDNIPESDVFLLASAKDRLAAYQQIYDNLVSNGIKCEFYISRVPKELRRSNDGIHYIDKDMPYKRSLEYICKCKCILDIQQGHAVGFTQRLWEAVLYDKKLLTDNDAIINSDYYDCRYVSKVNNGYCDLDFIRSNQVFINPFKDRVSPISLLNFIADNLM